MYRVLRPNKGLVAFEMRGSRDGGGLEVCAHMPLRMPAGVLPGTRAVHDAHPLLTTPRRGATRSTTSRRRRGAPRPRQLGAASIATPSRHTHGMCMCMCMCMCKPCPCPCPYPCPCPCVDACDTCMHTHDMHMHMQHAHAHATCTCTCTLYLPPYAVHPRARVAKLRRAALPVGDAAADRGALRGLHPAAVERHHGHHCHRTSQVPAGDARAPLDGPADRRRQGGPS